MAAAVRYTHPLSGYRIIPRSDMPARELRKRLGFKPTDRWTHLLLRADGSVMDGLTDDTAEGYAWQWANDTRGMR